MAEPSPHESPTITEIALDIDRKENFIENVKTEIARDKARTENRLATILVCALIASLPVYYVAVYYMPSNTAALTDAIDRWFTVLGPLAGAALGVGYLRNSSSK